MLSYFDDGGLALNLICHQDLRILTPLPTCHPCRPATHPSAATSTNPVPRPYNPCHLAYHQSFLPRSGSVLALRDRLVLYERVSLPGSAQFSITVTVTPSFPCGEVSHSHQQFRAGASLEVSPVLQLGNKTDHYVSMPASAAELNNFQAEATSRQHPAASL
ncbi:hypothetical protein VTK73DRAFT_258 [Phialemonium thermophilum]|uniref:Uncharacterized protein n=1 Tax=Phialemonium thermophilum TaxID=223376 RepID=A0ABR3XG29_9PEZI